MIDTLPRYKAFCRLLKEFGITNTETASTQFLVQPRAEYAIWLIAIGKLDDHIAKRFPDYNRKEESLKDFFIRKFGSKFDTEFNRLAGWLDDEEESGKPVRY